MPRKALVAKEDAVKTIEKFIEHFRTDDLPKFTSQVWVDMSKDLNEKWTAQGVYTAVRENRRGILSEARKNQGIVVPDAEEMEGALGSNASGSSVPKMMKKPDIESRVRAHLKSLKRWYHVTVDGDTWNKIEPRVHHKYGEKGETYVTASPSICTETIFDAFAEEYCFPCAYILRRAKIRDSHDTIRYMEIYAECRSRKCYNCFFGLIEKKPWWGEPMDIKIKTWDTRLEDHEIMHRPILTSKRRQIEDGDSDDSDDSDTGQMPRVENIRNKRAAKKKWKMKEEEQQQQQQLEIKDPEVEDLAAIIQELMTMDEYVESIQQIGLVPFSVMYTTPRQMHVYNEYCNAEAWSSVKIEMRKNIVRKIRQRYASETKDVYLSSIIFNMDGNESFMAYQMISERINYPLVMYWLGSWFENGARKPKEVISNYCRVFLSAACLAFNGFSLESYIYRQFVAVSGLAESSDYQWPKSSYPTRTSVRVDIRNLRSIVGHWQCFDKVNHPCIRDFYIRCVDLMIEAKTFGEFTEILSLTLVVAFSACEDSLLEYMALSPKMSRKKLESIIAKSGRALENIAALEGNYHGPGNAEPVLEDVFIDTDQLRPVTNWLEELVKHAKTLETPGTELNAFYLPDFAENLAAIAHDFPLWTKLTASAAAAAAAATVQDYTCTKYVDQYFQDWQPRILAAVPAPQQFPIRADTFVKAHLDEINEAAATLESVLTNAGLEPVTADDGIKMKHPLPNVRVVSPRIKDPAAAATSATTATTAAATSATTAAVTSANTAAEYRVFDLTNKSNTSDDYFVYECPDSESSLIEKNQDAQKKATNRDNILSACIVETDELGICHRRNIKLDFSEL